MNPLRKFKLSRRTVLRGMAGGAAVSVALPPLEAMMNSNGTAYANGEGLPRRFISFFWGNGVMLDRFEPTITGPDWELTEELAPFGPIKEYVSVLTGIMNRCSNIITHHEGMTIFNGYTYNDGQGMPPPGVSFYTDFAGPMGSGLTKMLVVGLGKHAGASAYHAAALTLGYEAALMRLAKVVFARAPILGGVAIVENAMHDTARVEVLAADAIPGREPELCAEAATMMPALPFDEIDLLIVDQIGKNISGTGMDTNTIGRGVHGYNLMPGDALAKPFIESMVSGWSRPRRRWRCATASWNKASASS